MMMLSNQPASHDFELPNTITPHTNFVDAHRKAYEAITRAAPRRTDEAGICLTILDDRSITCLVKRDTKNAIMEAAAPLIHRQGFHGTGLKEILDAAEVPKGSFYFYFKSKEDFGLALIEHYGGIMRSMSAPILEDKSIPPLKRLEGFFAMLCKRLEERGCELGCPIGTLAQEMSDLSTPMREALHRGMASFSAGLAAVLEEARERGELAGDLDPGRTAAFLFDAWEGALLRMKTEKSPAPLERFQDFVFNRLLR